MGIVLGRGSCRGATGSDTDNVGLTPFARWIAAQSWLRSFKTSCAAWPPSLVFAISAAQGGSRNFS